jgi:bifunctional non-homologous end joining protein LigD
VGTRRPSPGNARPRRRPAAGEPPLPDLSQYGQLAEYNRRRHFGRTPEPPGRAGERAAGTPRQFVVQKHRASHLHYDFRLEHRGVMLSWAVPKGPSPDPSVKRLAMETEPHPLDYNQFEGVIPAGEYGGGTVMIWDKGVWAPVAGDRLGDDADVDRALARGELKLVLLGEKLAGSWVLVRTRGSRQWLLIKHRDAHASDEDLAVTRPRSVVSDRTMAEIARAAGATPAQLAQAIAADPVAVEPGSDAEARPRAAARPRHSRRSAAAPAGAQGSSVDADARQGGVEMAARRDVRAEPAARRAEPAPRRKGRSAARSRSSRRSA